MRRRRPPRTAVATAGTGVGRRVRAVAVVAVVLLGAVACGGPELTTVASRGIVLDRPAAWREITDLPTGGLLGRQGWVGDVASPGRAALFVDVFCADDVDTVVDGLVAQGRAERESFAVRRRVRVAVPGADAAVRVESGYRQPSPAATGTAAPTAAVGAGVGVARLDVLAVAGGVTVRVGVTGPAEGLDRDLARRVAGSLRLRRDGLQPLVDACAGRSGDGGPAGATPPADGPSPTRTRTAPG